MPKPKSFLWYFLLLLLIELIVVSNPNWHPFRIISKPLIVGSLLFFFVKNKLEKKTKIFVTTALICTLIGDVQLIFAGEYDFLFMGGLAAFLLSNIIYIFQFSRKRNKKINFVYPSLILLFYAGTLFWYLMDSLEGLIVPVAFYMITAWLMILFAYLRKDDLTNNGYIYVLTGALLLMLSASIVAITRFKSDIPFSAVLVMAVHGIAQLSLVMGILISDPVYISQKSADN